MAKNQRHITIASFNYLYEVSAIPEKIRENYLQSLRKRKDITKQKNVKLLLFIYNHIDENKISRWNPEQICDNLGISMNALYLHKSRLLKGLREYYFNWKKIENEIEAKNTTEKNSIKIKLQKALKMYEIGMRKEAKNAFVNLSSKIKNTAICPGERYIIQTEIYKHICIYYCNTGNRKKLLYYYNEIYNIYLNEKELILTTKQRTISSINLNFCRFYLSYRNLNKKKHLKLSEYYLDRIYSDSKKTSDYYNLLTVIYSRSIFLLNSGNIDEAVKLCREGYIYASETGNKTQKYIFLVLMYYARTNVSSNPEMIKQFIDHYNRIIVSEPLNEWTVQFLNILTSLYYPERRREIKEILNYHINSHILIGDHSQAVFLRYKFDSENYTDRLISYFLPESIKDEGYLQINKIDNKLLNEIENLCINTLCYHKAVNDTGIASKIYLYQLSTLFLHNGYLDMDKGQKIARKLEWLKKNKKLMNVNSFELLKLGFNILDPGYHSKKTTLRYRYRLLKVLDNFKNNPSEFKIMDYVILSSLAGRAKNKEITNTLRNFYSWLETNHPEILEPVFREFKERESNIYTISGAA